MAVKAQRNGKIEFLRFIFCMYVLFYHAGSRIFQTDIKPLFGQFTFFKNGCFGVEFFFILSGFFFAKTALDMQDSKNSLTKDTYTVMFKKYKSIFPYHLFSYFLTFIIVCIYEAIPLSGIFTRFVYSIPELFLVQMGALNVEFVNGPEWYISSMLIAMTIIFPLLKKHYKVYSRYIAPISAWIIIAFLWHANSDNAITHVGHWYTFASAGNLRAFAEISIGIFIFEVTRKIKEFDFKKSTSVWMTVAEVVCYLTVSYYAVSTSPESVDHFVLLVLVLAMTLTFSGVTYLNKPFQNKFWLYIGKLTLPMYLMQFFVIRIVNMLFPDWRGLYKLAFILVFIFLISVAIERIITLSKRNSKEKALKA